MIELKEHKRSLIEAINSAQCLSKNQLIALLELKKYELVKELFDGVQDDD